MQMKTRWMRAALAGGSLLVAGFLVACGDDNAPDAQEATGSGTVIATEPTATPSTPELPTREPDSQTSPAPPSSPASDEPPVTTATANGLSVETGIGTYCWTLLCVDMIGVPTKGTLTVSRGDTVTIAVPEDAPALREASANVFEATDAQTLDDGSEIWPYPGTTGEALPHEVAGDAVEVTVDLPPGTYVLAASMYFEVGDVTYGVLLEVQ